MYGFMQYTYLHSDLLMCVPFVLHSFAWANKHVFDCRTIPVHACVHGQVCVSVCVSVCVFTVILYLPKASILIMLQSVSLYVGAGEGIPL